LNNESSSSFDGDDWEDDYPPQAKPDDSDGFVTESDSDEEDNPKRKNKRNQKEDPRNRLYLQHYRETVELEQTETYFDIRAAHTLDFHANLKGKKKLLEVESMIRLVYKEQCVTKEDLVLRDKVI
jgi:hypothetical protein